jgi:hypothetical protein
MHFPSKRYQKTIWRYSLAGRMVGHEARTETIRQWTGLSERRVKELFRSCAKESVGQHSVRHRGPSPQKASFFLRSPQMREEAAALAALCRVLQVIPPRMVPNARRELPGLARGERLCSAFEMYQTLIGNSEITLERAVLLVIAIAQGTELQLGHCLHCGGAIVFDPLAAVRRACSYCREAEPAVTESASKQSQTERRCIQQRLF